MGSSAMKPICLQSILAVFFLTVSPGQNVKHIAVVRDGDSEFFNDIVSGFEGELATLADGQYEFQLLHDFNAQGNAGAVPSMIRRALDDPRVDVIYTAGIIASFEAQKLPEASRTKPIVAGAIEFSNFTKDGVSDVGTSSRPNLTFVLEPRRIPADLGELARLSGENVLYTFVDRAVVQSLAEDVGPRVTALEQELGVDVVLIPVGSTAASCLAALPKAAKAVYVPIIPSLPHKERRKLFGLLAARHVMAFSMIGWTDVEHGALAGLSPSMSQALYRRMALNLHQVLSGIPTTLLPVYLNSSDRLRVNMVTAQKIGWSPDYDTLLSAELLGIDTIQVRDGDLNLEQAMGIAAERNVDKRVAEARLLASYWETRSLRTSWWPQVSANGQAARQGTANRINPFAQANTDTLSLGAEVSQLLYSDRLTSQIRAQKRVEESTKHDLDSVRLDAIESAGLAYLDALLAEALYGIEQENVTLSIQNLNLAKTRSNIRAAEPSEVFRWEALLAQAKSQLIQSDSDRENARVALNVTLGEPRTKSWALQDIDLEDDDFYFMSESLRSLLTNLNEWLKYGEFVRVQAVLRAPELKALESSFKAQGILLAERGRRNFLPEVRLTASLQQTMTELDREFDDQADWTVGVGFTIPFFQGGQRKTEIERIKSVMTQLSAQRDKALYLVEQRALAGIYNASASHPALRLRRESLAASRKNYDSVKAKYSLGAASILDLLDAQSQLIQERKGEASAVYQYLKDVISIQRSMAWFQFSKTPEEQAAWVKQLETYLQKK